MEPPVVGSRRMRTGAVLGCMAMSLLPSGCITLSSRAVDSGYLATASLLPARSLQQEVDLLARPLVEQGITPGLMVGVYTPADGMQFFGYGSFDKRIGAPPGPDTVFAVGSLTKLFVGGLLSLYVQQGKLSWNDTLQQLLPEGTPLSEDAAAITLEQLATHTSGLPRQPMTVQTFSYFVRYLFTGQSFYDHFDRDYVYSFLSHFDRLGDADYTYSNFGYALIGHILELRSSQRLESLLEQHLLRPLALNDTALSVARLPAGLQYARGYAGDQPGFIKRGDPVPDWEFTDVMRATGAMHSTARDILTFARAHFARPETPLGAALAENLRVRVEREDGSGQAIDWEEDRVGNQKINYAIGFVAGYSSYLGVDAENHTAVVVLQNSFNWEDRVGHRLLIRLHNAPAQPTTYADGS